MTARVLVVDDIQANIKLLQARLTADYFDVLTATNGRDAIAICERVKPDVVLLDVMMPGMDGFEVCRRLKGNRATSHIPIVMVTALDQASDRLQGLEAGADDFLTKPVDDIALMVRVRNLARVKTLNDEMMMRATTCAQSGFSGERSANVQDGEVTGRILVVDDNRQAAERCASWLGSLHEVAICGNGCDCVATLEGGDYDLALVNLNLRNMDGLQVCTDVKSNQMTRHLPIICVLERHDEARLLRALDLGVNDYLHRPLDKNELLARVRTQFRRKRYTDFLRNRLQASAELAIIDPLTGLFNRRYMESHLQTLVHEALSQGRPLSLLIADVDELHRVNEHYGHDAGDVVLREMGKRIRNNTRGIDLACRRGSEEFAILMPDTDLERATKVGERLRKCIGNDVFCAGDHDRKLRMTVSVGIASLKLIGDTAEVVIKRADEALSRAQSGGQNRVSVKAA